MNIATSTRKLINVYVQEPKYVFPRKDLSDEVYAEAIEALIGVATDIIPINRERKTVYLAPRVTRPMAGWWWIGGRMYPGEPEEIAAQRNFQRETGLTIDPSRFEFVQMHRLISNEREQTPHTKGLDFLIFAFALEVSDQEAMLISSNLEKKEYTGMLGEFTRTSLVTEKVHKSILDFYNAVFDKILQE